MDVQQYASTGFVTFLFGIFTAYWAQTTRRSSWLWFFLGLFLGPIAGLVLLYKNGRQLAGEDLRRRLTGS